MDPQTLRSSVEIVLEHRRDDSTAVPDVCAAGAVTVRWARVVAARWSSAPPGDPTIDRRQTMRFILLARARVTGVVRLLSGRAFDSRSAAVDAATVTAHSIDLLDDEVLAVDLDRAGPVLVLRIEVPAGEAPARPEPAFTVAPASDGTPLAPAMPGIVDFGSERLVRLQPRFPLFGVDDDEEEETLAESLRRVARRMEADLTTGTQDEVFATAGISPDTLMVNGYAQSDGTDLLRAREESRVRGDAADLLFDMEAVRLSDAIEFRVTSGDVSPADQAPLSAEEEAPLPAEEEGPLPVNEEAPDLCSGEEAPRSAEEEGPLFADEEPVDLCAAEEAPVPASASLDEAVESPAETVFAAEWNGVYDEPTKTAGPETVIEAVFEEPALREVLPPGPLFEEPEPPTYRPADTDFRLWVCADCIYQRTCRTAGVATPATCGNFHWR
jgi:hypothetical protein